LESLKEVFFGVGLVLFGLTLLLIFCAKNINENLIDKSGEKVYFFPNYKKTFETKAEQKM
jgi:hypothetical protein